MVLPRPPTRTHVRHPISSVLVTCWDHLPRPARAGRRCTTSMSLTTHAWKGIFFTRSRRRGQTRRQPGRLASSLPACCACSFPRTSLLSGSPVFRWQYLFLFIQPKWRLAITFINGKATIVVPFRRRYYRLGDVLGGPDRRQSRPVTSATDPAPLDPRSSVPDSKGPDATPANHPDRGSPGHSIVSCTGSVSNVAGEATAVADLPPLHHFCILDDSRVDGDLLRTLPEARANPAMRLVKGGMYIADLLCALGTAD